jgi:hypothetical protein
MRILIDECLDWRLCRALIKHQCSSVRAAGWAGLTNGTLLEKAQQQFDVFLTGDPESQLPTKPEDVSYRVIVLEAESTRLIDTQQLLPQVLASLETVQPGQLVRIRPER